MNQAITRNYSLRELEAGLRTYNNALLQATRDPAKAVFTLAELKSDAKVLRQVLTKARSAPDGSLSFQEIGEALPRVLYWHHRHQKLHFNEIE